MKVCLDERSHGTETLAYDGLAQFQGPSLLVFNDSTFKESDFESISRIGDSVKRTQVGKTGRFGVGFNSVYHLTDMPSFVSGDAVFFDPHCEFLPNVTAANPGKRVDFVANDVFHGTPTSGPRSSPSAATFAASSPARCSGSRCAPKRRPGAPDCPRRTTPRRASVRCYSRRAGEDAGHALPEERGDGGGARWGSGDEAPRVMARSSLRVGTRWRRARYAGTGARSVERRRRAPRA